MHNYIYIRGEMMREYVVLQKAVDEAYARGYLGKNILGTGVECQLTVHRGAGAYICGEETALLNSLEGLRGQPRLKPPFPAVKGLFGNPTIVNNVETLMNVPFIIDKGGAWFNGLGMGRSGGTRIVCVSGHVNKPGVFELPMGITFNEIIDEVCGGVWKGRKVKAVIPGGVSMPPLDADELDVPCEFDALQTDERIKPVMVRPGQQFDLGGGKPLRTMAGSGGVVVMDDQTDIPKAVWRIMKFFAHESCGQCTPCREGTGWLEKVVAPRRRRATASRATSSCSATIAHGIAGNTICALGDAAAWPMMGFLTKFRADFEAKIRGGRREDASRPLCRGLAIGFAVGSARPAASARPSLSADGVPRRQRRRAAGAADGRRSMPRPGRPASSRHVDPHDDIVESHGKGMALLFWAFAAARSAARCSWSRGAT